jgi:hypothetical protein
VQLAPISYATNGLVYRGGHIFYSWKLSPHLKEVKFTVQFLLLPMQAMSLYIELGTFFILENRATTWKESQIYSAVSPTSYASHKLV